MALVVMMAGVEVVDVTAGIPQPTQTEQLRSLAITLSWLNGSFNAGRMRRLAFWHPVFRAPQPAGTRV